MQGYVPAQDGAFAESRRCFGELEVWMASEEAAGLQHGELEDQLDVGAGSRCGGRSRTCAAPEFVARRLTWDFKVSAR